MYQPPNRYKFCTGELFVSYFHSSTGAYFVDDNQILEPRPFPKQNDFAYAAPFPDGKGPEDLNPDLAALFLQVGSTKITCLGVQNQSFLPTFFHVTSPTFN